MTDFGTMSVTRSLSISTRNPSTSSSVSHFQSSFGSFYGALPLKDHHDLTSVTYPVGFYGNQGSEYFSSQTSGNGCGMPTTSSSTVTCHQQQEQQLHHHHHHHHHQQQQQQQRARSEWITFSKPFLLKLVEKLCQLSFENESVSQSSSPEVSGGQGRIESTNRSPTLSDGLISPNDFTSNSTTTTTTTTTASNNNDNNSGSRKSRLKSRPVKFVRPFESSEERKKNEDSDCGNINVESDHETINNNSNNATSPSSPNQQQPLQCNNNNNNKNYEKNKETLKRERDIGDDSDTEHVNVEDDDDDDGVMATNRMNLEKSAIDASSISLNKSIFNSIANSSSTNQIFNPLWSEYLKMNYNLTSTYQTVFNAHKVSSNQELNRQSWAAFNKSLVYKMFDDVLDTDKIQNQNQIYQTSQSSLHNARFLFASGGSTNHIGLHFPNGLDKHLGGVYEGAYCGERTVSRSNREAERDTKRSSLTQSRQKRLRDGFVRARHQLINRRNNRTKNSNIAVKSSAQEIREEKKESNSICDVPILGALLRSNDNRISSHKSSQLINNINKSNKSCPDQHQQQQQQQQHSVPKTTANINNTEDISSEVTIKNGFKQSSAKVETWPKWVALDKCQVRSLVDSLVATMMGTNENFSSPSTPPFKSRDESEMQVDYDHNKENENNDDSNRSYDNSTGSCNDQSQRSPPQNFEVSEAESSASHCADRDSETETNFSGDTQLEQSDLEECSRNADEMSDDGGSSSIKDGSDDTDGCTRMECHSTHHRCSIKWKSNMLKRMKAEEPEKES